RDRLRSRLDESLATGGIRPTNFPERVASEKLVEELLDHVAGRGFAAFGDLRDAVSRNQLKLPDLTGPKEWLAGDPLLRTNFAIATQMPAVYRRAEVYLRTLQRASAIAFGTKFGRLVTLNFIVPFGGSFLLIEGPCQIFHELLAISRALFRWVHQHF